MKKLLHTQTLMAIKNEDRSIDLNFINIEPTTDIQKVEQISHGPTFEHISINDILHDGFYYTCHEEVSTQTLYVYDERPIAYQMVDKSNYEVDLLKQKLYDNLMDIVKDPIRLMKSMLSLKDIQYRFYIGGDYSISKLYQEYVETFHDEKRIEAMEFGKFDLDGNETPLFDTFKQSIIRAGFTLDMTGNICLDVTL